MKIKGSIRRHSNNTDVAFIHEGTWSNLNEGSLKNHIITLYEFLLSPMDTKVIFNRTVKKQENFIKGNKVTTIEFPTPAFNIKLTRYSNSINGNKTPSDRSTVELEFPTTQIFENNE